MRIELTINGTPRSFEIKPGMSLLELLRQQGYHEVKQGCNQGQCGSCLVLVDGVPINSCVLLAAKAAGAEVLTVQGIEQHPIFHALQDGLVKMGAIQCGYCSPGVMIASYALLRENPSPSELEIKRGLEGNLCRCTGYVKLLEGIKRASHTLASQK